ncbi:MAG: hypothetical protein HND57_14285 [Planctomycetes bacterium]|nr:hypothetical protein [Planctomycetota bacterium]
MSEDATCPASNPYLPIPQALEAAITTLVIHTLQNFSFFALISPKWVAAVARFGKLVDIMQSSGRSMLALPLYSYDVQNNTPSSNLVVDHWRVIYEGKVLL